MVLIDYAFRPAPVLPVLPPVKPVQSGLPHPLDREIVNFLRHQPEAVKTWDMVNSVTSALNPDNRTERRELTKRIMARISPLVYAHRLRRVGRNYLALR